MIDETNSIQAKPNVELSKCDVAVLIPCYNEAATVETVVKDFQEALPSASIYVYDNNSTDETANLARAAGAQVRHVSRQGKGRVVYRMFSDIEADIYVLVDGDDTYDPSSAQKLIQELLSGPYDMVNGARVAIAPKAYRRGHALGNKVITGLVRYIFGSATEDMLSGYKVLSHRFVKSFCATATGFEIETELTIHALQLRMPVSELPIPYGERPDGSKSKLSTFKDGFRILRLIALLIKDERPMFFFTTTAVILASLSVGFGVSIVLEFLETGLVPRFPTAILATGLAISGLLSLLCGIILEAVSRGRWETKRLYYLSYRAPR